MTTTMQIANHVDLTAGRQAAVSTTAALSMLGANDIRYERIDGARYLVAGTFIFWPVNGFWKSNDGARRGYGVRTLIASVNG